MDPNPNDTTRKINYEEDESQSDEERRDEGEAAIDDGDTTGRYERVTKGGGKKREMSDAEAEEKKAERRAANRRSAFQSRQRRKILIEDLQRTVAALSKDNNDLRKCNGELRTQLEATMLENRQFKIQQQTGTAPGGSSGPVNATAADTILPTSAEVNSSSSSTDTPNSSSPHAFAQGTGGVNLAAVAAFQRQMQLAALIGGVPGANNIQLSPLSHLFGGAPGSLGMLAAGFGGPGAPGGDPMLNARLAMAAAAGLPNLGQGSSCDVSGAGADSLGHSSHGAHTNTPPPVVPPTATSSMQSLLFSAAAARAAAQSSGIAQGPTSHNPPSSGASASAGQDSGRNEDATSSTPGSVPTAHTVASSPTEHLQRSADAAGLTDAQRALIRGMATHGGVNFIQAGRTQERQNQIGSSDDNTGASNVSQSAARSEQDGLANLSAAALNSSAISEALRNLLNKK